MQRLNNQGFILRALCLTAFVAFASFGFAITVSSQTDRSAVYSGMRWRLIGPHRAGRVTSVAGIPGQPAIYYFGTPGGGVWKTTNGGRTWLPIFDAMHQAAIGALALAPSNPNIIYVGTGEQVQGNGVYKSTDAGATWSQVGLSETNSITSLIVDPHDPNIVVVGAVGPFGPGDDRGIFKTTDGGQNWKKVFFKNGKTGISDMCADPDDFRTIYAATGTLRFNPREPRPDGSGSAILRSNDGGSSWQPVKGAGLPAEYRGRVGIAVAPGTSGKRVYAIMNQGFYRTDDGGESWQRSTNDPRVLGSGYFSRVFVNPKNADDVHVMQTATYRSLDGGKTFASWKGSPSGEDPHIMWIAPDDPKRIFMGTDQGAVITLDDGLTWTEWFNQPTGEMYHVTTDGAFPYRLYASQQDTGSVVVPSRSDFGQITFRDWFPSGSFESGYIAPDPANANFIYSVGWFGTVLRLDRRTNQIATVFVPGPKYRYTWETPLVFSPIDPKTLYVGMQHVLKTTDGSLTWTEISPDLTTKPDAKQSHHADVNEDDEDDKPQAPGSGVIQTIAPSAAKDGVIWVGTSTGLVQLTRDAGKTWQNVTPRGLPERAAIILIEASPLNGDTAYAIANVFADSHPYIYRTRDAGQNWQKIGAGLPEKGIARVVREDPARTGLVYAGTETGAHVSFDGGDHWQPLSLNLPTVSVRDLKVHGKDLVAATYGRGLWSLDNLSPLRNLEDSTSSAKVQLFPPDSATRVRWDSWPDTPLPVDTPAGENPADGAIIDYYLQSDESGEITLDVRDEHGRTVRHYSSTPPPAQTRLPNAPEFWFAPPAVLSTKAGLHRFVWNLQWEHPPTLPFGYYGQLLDYTEYTVPDHAIGGQTPRDQPPGPYVVPGRYEVILTVAGQSYRQSIEVKADPRVPASQADLQAQLDLARQITDGMASSYKSYYDVAALAIGLAERKKTKPDVKDVIDAITALEKQLTQLADGNDALRGFGPVNRDLARYLMMIESGDLRPVQSARENAAAACEALRTDLAGWRTVNSDKLPALNKLLEQNNLTAVPTILPPVDPLCVP
ncbi:MAG TPA: hypothetical protein VLL54_03060 [Pyrinomonadaceae bacterium]|nr:hypothetical protein [Pyrinomonadaceae bacterium]